MELEKFIISETQLIEQAIELIEMNHSRCVIVVNAQKKVVGVLSEGDILRAILKGVSIKSPAKNVMMTGFKYLLDKDETKIMEWFKKGFTLIPILADDFTLKEMIVFTEYFDGKK
jgi:CBS domain-containing protein